jgi:hypothetical protein
MNELRNPIAHTAGPSGVTYQVLGRPSESRIKLEPDQADALKKAARAAHMSPSEWGVHEAAQPKPLLEPAQFLSAFGLRTIGMADELINALADDLAAQRSADVPAMGIWKDLPKLALLAGVPDRLRA